MAHLLVILGIAALLVLPQLGPANGLPDGWTLRRQGEPFGARVDAVIDDGGRPVSAIVLSFPANTVSEPGWFVAAATRLAVPAEGSARLLLAVTDSFDGPTSGYHYVSVTVNGQTALETDVAGPAEPRKLDIDLRALSGTGEVAIEFRLAERKAVSNFPIAVRFEGLRLVTADGARDLLPPPDARDWPPLPPDPPISGPPLVGEDWTRTACILQPWGASEWEIVTHARERVPWLAREFGFNAVIMLPPEAHNTITPEGQHLTREQFAEALRIFREAGFRFILYTAVMHCGHAPQWMDGTLAREHPEWSQRGPQGETVSVYGQDWLCPSTGALDYTIAYTRKLVELYQPDAVMLDNNEFFPTPSGLTCYCDGCQAAFRRYVRARFGDTAFGEPTSAVRIPTERGPLYALWLHWRNCAWAEANEAFRRDLARTRPGTVLLANTQYLYSGPALATDLQYEHEDAMLSESRSEHLRRMVPKLLLGQSISARRPLWNYLGTFRERDQTRLRPADEVAMNVSTAFATGARPWIVYYGFTEHPDDEANQQALGRMASTLRWHLAHDPARADLRPYAPVLALVSHTSRNVMDDELLPSHLAELRNQGIPVRLIEERHVSERSLRDARVLLIASASCLSRRAADAIARWVRTGGRLYATPVVGAFDEVGRLRKRSALLTALSVNELPAEPAPVGRGAVARLDAAGSSADLVNALRDFRFRTTPEAQVEFLPYVERTGDLLVYVCAEEALPSDLLVHAPAGLAGRAIICSTDSDPTVVPVAD
jgi:hypothetical protein